MSDQDRVKAARLVSVLQSATDDGSIEWAMPENMKSTQQIISTKFRGKTIEVYKNVTKISTNPIYSSREDHFVMVIRDVDGSEWGVDQIVNLPELWDSVTGSKNLGTVLDELMAN